MTLPPTPKPEVLSYEDLRAEVFDFVSDFKVDQPIPIDVEEIADVRLSLDIVPVPGLRGSRDIDAYLSADRKSIYVDEGLATSLNQNRYRFTIAHEIGHWYLHEDLYVAAGTADCDCTEFINSIPTEDWSWYEYRAYTFAGLLLVPKDPLALEVAAALAHAKASGFASIDPTIDAHRDSIAEWVSRAFHVSPEVIIRRGKKDGHWPGD